MTPQDLSALWFEAHARWLQCLDAEEAKSLEVSEDIPWPVVTHGKRRTAYLSDVEIDRDKRLSDATKARLKKRLARVVDDYNAARERYGLVSLDAATNAAAEEMGELGHALASDRSGTPQAIVAKLRLLAADLEDGADMSGYAKGMLAAALADAEAMCAGPAADLAEMHSEWRKLMDQCDGHHNGPRETRPPQPDYDRIADLEDAIADHPDTSPAAHAIRLDVALGTFVGAAAWGDIEMLEEAAITGATAALERIADTSGPVKLWTPSARQRGLERLNTIKRRNNEK